MKFLVNCIFIVSLHALCCAAGPQLPLWLQKGIADSSLAYAEISMGYGFFDMQNLNSHFIKQYSPVFRATVDGGSSMDAEIGVYIAQILRVGISYVQTKAVVESNDTMTFRDRETQREITWDEWYLDSYFKGVGFSVRYYPVRLRFLRIFAGGKHTLGLGMARLGMGTRPDDLRGDYGYDNFIGNGFGINALAGAQVSIVPHMLFGCTAGYRILRTEVLRNTIDGAPWRRPPADPHDINLDFSGFFAQATISFEL